MPNKAAEKTLETGHIGKEMNMPESLCSKSASARAKVFGFLAQMYVSPPDLELLGLLEEWVVLQIGAKDSFGLLTEQMKRGLTALDNFFGDRMGSNGWKRLEKDASLEEAVSIEFTKLFRGVSPDYSPPPPYGSVYLDEGERAFGDESAQVQREYRRFGLDLASKLHGEPPDHLSFELEFMFILCTREAEAWERVDTDEAHTFLRAEKQFLGAHLMSWLPKFCQKIRESDRLGLLAGITDVTEGWVTFDYEENLQSIELPLG
jgi:TorA maturation chaperone TorD